MVIIMVIEIMKMMTRIVMIIIIIIMIIIMVRAALTTHKLEWLEPWGKLAELELKCSNRELVYVGNTNVTQST